MNARRALLILAVGAIAYSNSFSVPFHFDDKVVILGEPAVTEFGPSPASRRFLGDLSFALSFRLFGTDPAGYHAFNLAIHLANALLVFWLARLLSLTEPMRRPPAFDPSRLALLVALLFVAHPLQTQAVTYIAQRYASLAAVFFLFATCCYIRFRLAPGDPRSFGWYASFLASAAAAFWTKENTFVLPVTVAAIEILFFSGTIRRRLVFFAPFLAAAGLAATRLVHSGLTLERLDAATRVDTPMPRSEYAITQLRVVGTYLRLLVWPTGQNLDYDFEISRSLGEPRVLLALVVHVALLAGAAVALVRGARRNPLWRLVGFGILWFYVALLVESSFIPIVDVIYEHRAYLPSVGVLLAISSLAIALSATSSPRRCVAAAAAAVLLLAGLTFARNRTWRDELTLWSDTVAKSPRKPRPLNNLGNALSRRGDVRAALTLYDRAIRSDPSYWKAHYNRGEALRKMGDCSEAIPAFRVVLETRPEYPDTYRHLAECYQEIGQPEAARWFRMVHERVTRERAGNAPPTRFR